MMMRCFLIVLLAFFSCLPGGDGGGGGFGFGGGYGSDGGSSGGSGDGSNGDSGGGTADLYLNQVYWGRLVHILDLEGRLVETDVVIRENLISDSNYVLARNPVTYVETLTIQLPSEDLYGNPNPAFEALLTSAQSGLTSIPAKGPNANGIFTRVARNGAVKLEFSDFLDPNSVNRHTVPLDVNGSVSNTRYIVKQEIDESGQSVGVIIVDPTITPYDSAETGLPESGSGFEESEDQLGSNGLLRIPTLVEPFYGQSQVLTNLEGTRSLSVRNEDPSQSSDGGAPVLIRAFRTGNLEDPFRGFMVDMDSPSVLGSFEVDIHIVDNSQAGKTRLSYALRAVNCRGILSKLGDVVEYGDNILLVTQLLGPDPFISGNVLVEGAVAQGEFPEGDYTAFPLEGAFHSKYTDAESDLQLCWVRFTPVPETLPATGVDPFASISIRFTEAVVPLSVLPLSSMVLHSINEAFVDSADPSRPYEESEFTAAYIDRLLGYTTTGTGSGRIYLGPIGISLDSRTFTMAPSAGISNANNDGVLRVALALRSGDTGIMDLAGNPLSFEGFVAGNTGQEELLSFAGTLPDSRYFALRANSLDENGDGMSEYSGQYDFDGGIIRGRSVYRFSRLADPSNLYVGQRAAFASGVMTPLTPAGSVLMTIWGYHHLGLGLTSLGEMDLDVEGLNWSPFNGVVYDDIFDRYSIALAHSQRYPDDYINPSTGYPQWEKSGLKRTAIFDLNILGFNQGYDEEVVFDTRYSLSAADVFLSERGSMMAPWPDFETTYTWRDTSIPEDITGTLAADKCVGVPPAITGQPGYWLPQEVPSAGLPLLARFRCYPRGDWPGPNGFQVQIMCPSQNLPAFRVFSFGGNGGDYVIPDVGVTGTTPSGGLATGGGVQGAFGPELYWHQIDFVVRVSRVYTHWFPFGGVLNSVPVEVIDPFQQLAESDVTVEWRGAETLDVSACAPAGQDPRPSLLQDAASQLDFYGEYIGSSIHQDRLYSPPPTSAYCSILGSPSEWTLDHASLAAEEKWQFFQLRFTFLSDIEENVNSELDAYGFAWTVQP